MKHFLLLIAVCFLCCNNSEVETLTVKDYNSYHKEAKTFCKENDYNESYYFLVDLSIHSGKNRFLFMILHLRKYWIRIWLRMEVVTNLKKIQISGKR
jgi:hypothetical protein